MAAYEHTQCAGKELRNDGVRFAGKLLSEAPAIFGETCFFCLSGASELLTVNLILTSVFTTHMFFTFLNIIINKDVLPSPLSEVKGH